MVNRLDWDMYQGDITIHIREAISSETLENHSFQEANV